MIGILDIGTSNIRSMENAVRENGFDPLIVRQAFEFDALTHLIVPGVGNFGAAIASIAQRYQLGGLRAFVEGGRPLLGVCLGMHLLAEQGEEGGNQAGLGFIPGTVRKLEVGAGLRLPHVGWNVLNLTQDHPVFAGLKTNRDFYFVHGYAMYPSSPEFVFGETDYGGPVAAVVGRGNVLGVQFHPEKSQANGLKLLENFCSWDGRC